MVDLDSLKECSYANTCMYAQGIHLPLLIPCSFFLDSVATNPQTPFVFMGFVDQRLEKVALEHILTYRGVAELV